MTQNVSDILSAISEAHRALSDEPMLKARIVELEATLHNREAHIEGLETNIRGYKSQIDDLQSRVRSLEVERDQAQFRNLELEEAIHKLGFFVNGDIVAHLNNALEVCKTITSVMDQALPKPQPEPAPEPAPVNTEAVNDPSPPTASPNPTPQGPYVGKKYSEFPNSMSLGDWLAGGGTDADYDWPRQALVYSEPSNF